MSRNMPFQVGSLTELWNKVMKEVSQTRYAGPFKAPPCTYFIQSPLGLVPKKGNKTRLIFHLLYDFGKELHEWSVNFHTPDDLCTVKYNDLDNAIQQCLRLLQLSGLDSPVLFFSKLIVQMHFVWHLF